MTTKLATIEINTAPANIAAMMENGMFHSHQDGRWRYSAFGGETVYVNDPTAQFTARAEFANSVAAAAHRSPDMFARIHADGTRGLTDFCPRREPTIWLLYAPRNDGERQMRAWLADQFKIAFLAA